MTDTATLAAQYRADLAADSREDTPENRRAWLWFTCPAPLRGEVEAALPPFGPESRSVIVRLRFTPREQAAVRDAAAASGETVASYIRRHLPCLSPGE